MNRPTYTWTFVLLLALVIFASIAYVSASNHAFSVEYFWVVSLVGCVLVILRLTTNMIVFERVHTAPNREVPLLDVAAVTCPDFWTRITDENTQKPKCINSFSDGTAIGSIDTITVDLSDGSTSPGTGAGWGVTFCDKVKKDVVLYPRTTSAKLCEYLGRT